MTIWTRTTAKGARQSLRPFGQPPMLLVEAGEACGSDAAAVLVDHCLSPFSSLRMGGLDKGGALVGLTAGGTPRSHNSAGEAWCCLAKRLRLCVLECVEEVVSV